MIWSLYIEENADVVEKYYFQRNLDKSILEQYLHKLVLERIPYQACTNMEGV